MGNILSVLESRNGLVGVLIRCHAETGEETQDVACRSAQPMMSIAK